jgi:hypothetical protein
VLPVCATELTAMLCHSARTLNGGTKWWSSDGPGDKLTKKHSTVKTLSHNSCKRFLI